MKDKEKLIEAEKELFFSYTGIDVSGIGVEIVD